MRFVLSLVHMILIERHISCEVQSIHTHIWLILFDHCPNALGSLGFCMVPWWLLLHLYPSKVLIVIDHKWGNSQENAIHPLWLSKVGTFGHLLLVCSTGLSLFLGHVHSVVAGIMLPYAFGLYILLSMVLKHNCLLSYCRMTVLNSHFCFMPKTKILFL